MSQITRCPSCATSFKVVADQLRISEGWVRCGQCKEVFDASAHLLPSAPPSLLPDVSLTDVKPPPAPVARVSDAGRAWGVTPPTQPPMGAPAVSPTTATGLGAATRTAASRVPESAAPAPPAPAPSPALAPLASSLPSPSPAVPPPLVMDVPTPAVPAFLTAGASGSAHGELSLEPVTPFAWRPPLPTPAAAALHTAVREAGVTKQPLPAAPTPAMRSPSTREVPPPAFADTEPASLDSLDLPPVGRHAPDASASDAERVPGGYELPFADIRDSGWPDEVVPADELPARPSSASASAPAAAAAAVEAELAFPSIDVSAAAPSVASGPGQRRSYATPPDSPTDIGSIPSSEPAGPTGRSEVGLPPVDFAPPPVPSQSVESLALVADDSIAAVLRADARKTASAQDRTDEDADPEHEVSFVRAARRQALWRRPVVRLMLTLLALTALVALALQVAVQERDRIAAMDARTRPWLAKLCAPLHCEIAPLRQIADVVIDSSSFNKARGDSYQLALTMKSQATIPLATPAIELTLTDAQDQPVLRRVLLPTDMAAPAELPAGGEWTASVAVIVTTGGARVAGYRLLAFYP
ncbi:MAG: DUF3426 domain-containing protein [Gammaproteobacteria bacterium]|nr:DUF3426 domain-containing protein [Gammaproteobacteria bacterium]